MPEQAANAHSSLLNQSCSCSPGGKRRCGGHGFGFAALPLTSRRPPGDRRLPAEKMGKGRCQGGEESRRRAQPTSFCLSCLKLVSFRGWGWEGCGRIPAASSYHSDLLLWNLHSSFLQREWITDFSYKKVSPCGI